MLSIASVRSIYKKVSRDLRTNKQGSGRSDNGKHRRTVQAAFGWDIAQLIFYFIFLVLFSVNNVYNPDTYSLYNSKSIIAGAFIEQGDLTGGWHSVVHDLRALQLTCILMRFVGVTSIPKIYNYLQKTVVPSVAARNVTLIDARCTADGRHMNPVCNSFV